MNLHELFESCVETTESTYASAPGDYETMTMFICHTEADDGIIVAHTPWANEEEKVEILKSLRILMKERGVDFYVMVSEVWAVAVKAGSPDEAREQMGGVMPMHHPDRQEKAILLGADKAGAVLHASWTIHRSAEGIKLVKDAAPFHGGGRMSDLLK